MLAEPSRITSAVPGTTTETSITPSETEKATSYADIGTTQPTFSTAPSTTTGIFCQLDTDRPMVVNTEAQLYLRGNDELNE